ncbi:hypothetical protein M427DRAFT_134351 [Gonapodya prolifera JEL478]|uniref:Bacteriophage T5 Orf172 DNA-binding domain-containing protein n=1 Tax=Gonapodya prolifera (strain JEL478) TaxID=1344416 RepID=A0A139AIG5_GONPJ|nr:hypothetical protein M427DRAFT_134351 [Gonapodya prolifera JEL478]|eukprot:KXS16334.1 hypothetical protein M427DRAFT_134351 [Gonapodya prolifera JEL478]
MGDPGGDAEAFLSSFGTSLPAQTAHLLRTELLRPVSAADEGGYLYAYRIYSESPPTISSSSSSPSPSSTPSSSPPTHLLKIGRSLHPHRYLTQWSHHCNHPLTLIAVFPHSPGHITTPHPGLQCRLAHRAERLVHIHLGGAHPVRAGAGAGKCAGCGEVRREWFEGEWDEVRRAVEGWVGFVGVVRTGSGGGPKGGMVAGAGEDVGEAAMDVKLRNGSLIVPGTTSDLPGDHESIEGSVAPAVGSPRDLTLVDGSRPATLPPTGAPLAHKSTNGRAFEVPAPATDLKPIEGPPSATRTPLPPPRKRKYHVSTKRKPDPAVESDEDETWFTATED